MRSYKYTDDSNDVVHVIDEDGISRMSMLASAVPPDEDGVLPEMLPAAPRPVTVPDVIDSAQGQFILIEMDLWDSVLAYIAAIPQKKQREQVETAVMRTQRWRRDSPTLNQMASELGLTEQQKDELFIAASKVVF